MRSTSCRTKRAWWDAAAHVAPRRASVAADADGASTTVPPHVARGPEPHDFTWKFNKTKMMIFGDTC